MLVGIGDGLTQDGEGGRGGWIPGVLQRWSSQGCGQIECRVLWAELYPQISIR